MANNQNSEHSAEVSQEQLFRSEVGRKLRELGIEYSDEESHISIIKDKPDAARIYSDGHIASPVEFAASDEYPKVKKMVRLANEYCKAYANAQPLAADDLKDKYRCLAEFNETVFAAKYNAEYGFEFVVWLRTFNRNSVFQGHYFSDYAAAKEDFALRSGLISSDRVFSKAEMKELLHCVEFTLDADDGLDYSHFEKIKALKERIKNIVPEPQQDIAPELSM
ncbi:MAG: hypothetical protein J1F03_10465 [Oscillospiraceae bacterium]|nr:hypothetical protein [Oscillospiraceae bacterium]